MIREPCVRFNPPGHAVVPRPISFGARTNEGSRGLRRHPLHRRNIPPTKTRPLGRVTESVTNAPRGVQTSMPRGSLPQADNGKVKDSPQINPPRY